MAPSSMRLSSSELEITRPFADPHPGQVLSDVILPIRVTLSQSRHSKNFTSSLRAMQLHRDHASCFCNMPRSRAPFYTRSVATTSDRIKRADAGVAPQRPGVTTAHPGWYSRADGTGRARNRLTIGIVPRLGVAAFRAATRNVGVCCRHRSGQERTRAASRPCHGGCPDTVAGPLLGQKPYEAPPWWRRE